MGSHRMRSKDTERRQWESSLELQFVRRLSRFCCRNCRLEILNARVSKSSPEAGIIFQGGIRERRCYCWLLVFRIHGSRKLRSESSGKSRERKRNCACRILALSDMSGSLDRSSITLVEALLRAPYILLIHISCVSSSVWSWELVKRLMASPYSNCGRMIWA